MTLPTRGQKPDTKRTPPSKFVGRQRQLFREFKIRRWTTPAHLPAGTRFSAYVYELKAKGYVFEEKWLPIYIDGKRKERGVKAFRLISYPKN